MGSYSDKRIIPEKIAVKIPEGVSHKIAASIMTKGLTILSLCKTYKPIAGEIVYFMRQLAVLVKFFVNGPKILVAR